jgi:hypothetical protein
MFMDVVPNLALLDSDMDHGRFDDLLASVPTRWPHARMVVVLPSAADSRVASLGRRGAVVYKPLDKEKLRFVIGHWLRLAAMSSGVDDLMAASGLRKTQE